MRSRPFSPACAHSPLVVGILCLSMLAGCGDSDEKKSSISRARTQADGTQVTVEGYVTVPPGAFSSSIGDQGGFVIQDDSAGVYVKLTEKLDIPVGSHVRVEGKLGEQVKLRLIESTPSSVRKLDGTRQIPPKDVQTAAVNESIEGLLVKISAAVSKPLADDLPYGYKLFVNDGSGEVQVYIHVIPGFDPAPLRALSVGKHIDVTGFAGQYEAAYEVAPRQASDVVVR